MSNHAEGFVAGAKKRSYQFSRDERLESERIAKEIFHKIITGKCGDHRGRISPGSVAMASWGVKNFSVVRAGIHLSVSGAQFQGDIDIKAEQDGNSYTVDFFDANPALETPVKVLSISNLSGSELTDAIDTSVERIGLSDTKKWGNRAIHAKGFKPDLDTHDAVEWNESSYSEREAVVYDLFIRNPKATLTHMQNVPRIANREWQDLSVTERIMLVEFNVADALAEHKNNESQDSSTSNAAV